MSFGLFESALGSEQEVGLARQASADKLNTAVYDVKDKLGGFLFAASSLEEFRDRVAMTKNDQSLFKIIEGAGLHPATGTVRRIAGKNSILEEEFKQRLADVAGMAPAPEKLLTTDDIAGMGQTNPAWEGPQTPGSPGSIPTVNPAEPTKVGRYRNADFEGVQDIDSTFSHDEQGKELKPKDDWDGYRNKVDQDGPSKVQRNFASKGDWNVYLAWCESNNKSAARLSSLDTYASNLPDDKYLRLATTIQAWDNDHKPKVPNTKLKKKDKVAAGEYADQRAHDVAWMTAEERNQHGGVPSVADLQEKQKHTALHRYIAWCDRNNLSKVAKSTIDYYVSRVAGETLPPKMDKLPKGSPDKNEWPEGHWLQDDIKKPSFGEWNKSRQAALRNHLYSQVATTIRWAKKTGYIPVQPMTHPQGKKVELAEGQHEPSWSAYGDEDYEKSVHNPKRGSRRQAAPDYLQKADDALTQLLNQKAQEFQETIQPLQQALQTVQQAEQLAQQANPMNVLPPAGTVNVMPGGGQSTADQMGMPDPNAQDTSGLAALLSGAGGPPTPNDAPVGGGQDAPPPAAAGGGLPPDMDPNQQQQIAARRRLKRAKEFDTYVDPRSTGAGAEWSSHSDGDLLHEYRRSHPSRQKEIAKELDSRGISAKKTRQARGVGEVFDNWRQKKTQSGDLLRGGDPDYEQFANETGVGERALNKLKQRNQTPDYAPINGVTVGKRKRAYSDDFGPDDAGTSDDFHTYGDRENRGQPVRGPQRDNGWELNEGASSEEWHKGPHHVVHNDGSRGHEPGWYAGHQNGEYSGPHPDRQKAQIAAESLGLRQGSKRKKAEGTARSRKQAEQLTGPFAGDYKNFGDCEDKNSDKSDPSAYCGEIHNKVTKGRERKGEPLHDHQDKQSRRKRSAPLDTGRHSIDDPDNEHGVIMDPTSPYTGGPMMADAPDLTPKAARRSQRRSAAKKEAWSGFGPALFPKTRKVAGWDWDDGLQAYLSSAPRVFTCGCGDVHHAPAGYQRCKCGKAYNSYVIGTGGSNKEAAAEKFLLREIPVRPDVIVGARKQGYDGRPLSEDEVFSAMSPEARQRGKSKFKPHEPEHVEGIDYETGKPISSGRPQRKAVSLVDPRTGKVHRLIDPGELGEGEDAGHSTFKQQPNDWARRGDGGKWVGNQIG